MDHVPQGFVELSALTDDARSEPHSAIQYAVVSADGSGRQVYGDQSWVAYGRAAREEGNGARTQRRTITITYGEWEDVT